MKKTGALLILVLLSIIGFTQSLDLNTSIKETVTFHEITVENNVDLYFNASYYFKHGLFEIEQFKWNKWVVVASFKGKGINESHRYHVELNLHSATNKFRVKIIDNYEEPNYSDEVEVISQEQEVTMLKAKSKIEIRFNGETDFEVYDSAGKLIVSNRGNSINIMDFPKGLYYLNYDNKTEVFQKKK